MGKESKARWQSCDKTELATANPYWTGNQARPTQETEPLGSDSSFPMDGGVEVWHRSSTCSGCNCFPSAMQPNSKRPSLNPVAGGRATHTPG